MKKAVTAFAKFVIVTVILTVIIGGIAIKTISGLASENFALREKVAELENRVQESCTMTCSLHIDLLPSWNVAFLCYDFPMNFSTTWDYCNSYADGEVIPMLDFEGNYFIDIYVTA